MAEVSIMCTTYNQAGYLARALDSFLAQKTSFDYEIIVHDDASTDGTTELLREYADRYPDRILALYEQENKYSRGLDFWSGMFGVASGKYIAFCEGDDFWIDDNKLQLQWEALESNPECDMCACWGCTVTEDGNREISQIRPMNNDGILNTEQVILGGGQYLVSAGLFYRTQMCKTPMNFEKVIPLDYATQIRGSLRGGIYYLDRKMAVYRRYSKGSWTMNVLKNKDRLRVQWEKERELLSVLDSETNGRYHKVILERLKAYNTFVKQLNEHRDEIIKLFSTISGSCYVWGLGRRGEDFEEFCNNENLHIDGVCDLTNEHVDEISFYGNRIFNSEYVFENADNILASNEYAYNDLLNRDFSGNLVNLQKFMPIG